MAFSSPGPAGGPVAHGEVHPEAAVHNPGSWTRICELRSSIGRAEAAQAPRLLGLLVALAARVLIDRRSGRLLRPWSAPARRRAARPRLGSWRSRRRDRRRSLEDAL